MANVLRLSGLLLALGTLFFAVALLYCELSYPNYSYSKNFISDLGLGGTAGIFNAAAILTGLLLVAVGALLSTKKPFGLTGFLLGLSGIGVAGVGLFPETTWPLHLVSAHLAFFLGPLAAISSFKTSKPTIAYLSAVLGTLSLFAGILLISGMDFELGLPIMERIVVYPFMLWALVYGFSLWRK